MENVAIYARYSSSNQRDESIDAQVRIIKSYCEEKGYKVVKTYIDRERTAKTDKRPAFQQMIQDSEKGLFSKLIVHKLNRFARNMHHAYKYKSILADKGVKLESVYEKIDNSPQGVIIEAIYFGMAESYSLELAEETMKGLKENAYNCKHTGGKPPLGFDVDPTTKKLVVNKDEAPIIRLIFEKFDEGYSYNEIISLLNSKGYRTRAGREFGNNSIHELLRQEKYNGTYVYNKKASANSKGKRNNHELKPESEVIRIPNGCEAIIPMDLWNRVQAKMNSYTHTGGSSNAIEQYLLTGVVYCSECGRKMTGNRCTSGAGNIYTAYRCTNKNCSVKQIKKDWVERFVLAELDRTIFSDENIPKIIELIQADLAKPDSSTEKITAIEKQISNINSNISNIINSISEGISKDYFVDKLHKLEDEKAELETELSRVILATSKTDITEIDAITIKAAFANISNLINSGNINECRSFIRTYIDRVEISNDEISVKIIVPFSEASNKSLKLSTSIDRKDIKSTGSKKEKVRFKAQTDSEADAISA